MPGFEDLTVWQRAVALSVELYRETRSLRDFGFRDQVTRAGLSIASNIAEGMERSSAKDRIRFLEYSRGSCAEVRTQVLVGVQADMLNKQNGDRWCDETRQISAMLNGLIKRQEEVGRRQ